MKTTRNRNALILLLSMLLPMSPIMADDKSPDLELLVEGNTAFALELYAMLKNEEGNLFFSPYSISAALAMLYGGVRGNTARELDETLHFALEAERLHPAFNQLADALGRIQEVKTVQLNIANSLWPKKGSSLLPEYHMLIKTYYGAEVTPLDYRNATEKACKLINSWAKKQTQGKISDIVRPGDLNPRTALMLVNTIYCKAIWANQFDPDRTTDSDFTLLNGRKIQVPMMYQYGEFRHKAVDGTQVQVLELPYKGKQLSMIIILPNYPQWIFQLEKHLSAQNLNALLSRLNSPDYFTQGPSNGFSELSTDVNRAAVNVYLPRFKINWGTFNLKKALTALGIHKVFGPKADFSQLNDPNKLFVDSILHRAFVEVNEEGTEAAAVTVVKEDCWCLPEALNPSIPTFRADHPFIFLIRDNATGTILFLGRVLDPNMD